MNEGFEKNEHKCQLTKSEIFLKENLEKKVKILKKKVKILKKNKNF